MAIIKLEREICIGCGSCSAICPKYFEMQDDGKAYIIGAAKDEKGDDRLETAKIECAESAVEACPVQCIHIEK